MRFDGGINLLFHSVLFLFESCFCELQKLHFASATPVLGRRIREGQGFS